MPPKPTTVAQYLAALPADRRRALEAVRKVIRKNLDKGYEEGILYGMIGYYVPHRVYPDGYHCDPTQPLPFASLASQKNHMAVYLMCLYGDEEQESWFRKAWAKSGKNRRDRRSGQEGARQGLHRALRGGRQEAAAPKGEEEGG